MNTDNRTNEPRRLKSCVEAWPECETGEYNPSCCRFPKSCSATVYSEEHVTEDGLEPPAALVAAQGAAPQADALPETGNELRDEDGDLISSGKHMRILQQGMYVCDTCTNELGLNVRWDHAIKRDDHSPVLPSSGVDEETLANLIHSTSVAHFGGLDPRVAPIIARAVTEFLKGEER